MKRQSFLVAANIIQWPIEEIDELRSDELVIENELFQPGSEWV
jgi:hypothetical protein